MKFVVAHDTGNPGSTAGANVAYYERSPDETSASAHLFVDDREILECILAVTEPPEKAWHVLYGVPTDDQLFGYDANDAAIGVEYCFGGAIDADEAYRKYVWVLAYLCHHFALDPATSVVGHFFLDPKRKTDPCTGLARSRRTHEGLLRDVVAEHAACTAACTAAAPAPAIGAFVAAPGNAVVAARLNVRRAAPSTRAEVVQVVSPGTQLAFAGSVTGGEPVNGNPKWFRDPSGNYFWSGGVRYRASAPAWRPGRRGRGWRRTWRSGSTVERCSPRCSARSWQPSGWEGLPPPPEAPFDPSAPAPPPRSS